MIRKAKRTDFEDIFPILNQVFEEMDLATIKRLPISQFYDLMRLGFLSQYYRYSYQRIWVAVDRADRAVGLIDMYSYEDQKVIDFALKKEYAKVGLDLDTKIFTNDEALPSEWYIDSLAVAPGHWGQHIASHLLDYGFAVAKSRGFHRVSLNVDQENPRAQRLYVHKGFAPVSEMTIGARVYQHMVKEV
ncbi:GNAT family N-acetyltransferase [Lactobacillus sp. ESL0791]|uniref:GNAT family N-acetyltransferase n=1 Tax=Lactobacillus sp. ESL0791 TaxID=2983234 RepID=UPI0023F67B2E|nr:GNAT family N-acetyltransferase [Lactobacillus sp. ESL0791]MDF7638631.1 GNAT family N-acetyltransferase [Lactobacillus sp. ESL0791]